MIVRLSVNSWSMQEYTRTRTALFLYSFRANGCRAVMSPHKALYFLQLGSIEVEYAWAADTCAVGFWWSSR